MKRIALILSGCGVFDGSEIHEAVSAMQAIARNNAYYDCLAPNITQQKVINHITQEVMHEERSVIIESARLARGNIRDISTISVDEYDAAFYPGGFGAAMNLSNYATHSANMSIQPDVLRFAQAMAQNKKPQGFCCIAPVLISKIYNTSVQQTIGTDPSTISEIKKMGGEHLECQATNIIVDKQAKVVTTPAYMQSDNIIEISDGITKAIDSLLQLCN